MNAVYAGALLLALLLLLAAAMVWQEATRTSKDEPLTYVIEEAARFIYPRLSEEAIGRLDVEDVTSVLEWEVLYLQGRRAKGQPPMSETRIGGSDESVGFIMGAMEQRTGRPYLESDVREVLALEAAYLVEIGAIGPIVDGEAF